MNASDGQASVWQFVALLFATIFVVALAGLAVGIAVPGVGGPLDSGSDAGASDHQNPDDVSSGQELGQLERQLASRIQQQVQSGALDLNREDYENAREQLGSERYEQLREAYSNVESSGDRRDEQLLLREAQQGQFEYTELVGEYWDGLDEYEALENGSLENGSLENASTDRQRSKARELEEITRNLTETAGETIETYERLEEVSGDNYSTVISSINQSRANITAEQEVVRREQFIATNLTLLSDAPANISPADPLDVTAQLTTADGEPLSFESVPLEVGEQNTRTITNESGWFSIDYHPSLLPSNSTSVSIRYRPLNGSLYLGDEVSRNVTVTQTTPTVSVDATPEEVAYGSNVSVAGNVSVNQTAFADIPYLVRLEDEILTRDETAANGTIRQTISVPASVESGDREFTVQLLLENRSLRPTNGTTTLQVEQSETELRASADPTDGETILVSGALQTATAGASDQPLNIYVNGTAVGTARTEEDGQFQQQIIVPDSVANNVGEEGTVEITVEFDGSQTSLAPATATTYAPTTASAGGFSFTPWMLAPVGLVVALAGAYLLLRRSTNRAPTVPEPATPTNQVQEETTPEYLDRAGEYLEDGRPAPAVQASYAAIRAQFVSDTPRGQTHWEFYREHRDRLDESAQRALRVATEGYEQAAFAPSDLDTTTAREVLDAVDRLVDDGSRAN